MPFLAGGPVVRVLGAVWAVPCYYCDVLGGMGFWEAQLRLERDGRAIPFGGLAGLVLGSGHISSAAIDTAMTNLMETNRLQRRGVGIWNLYIIVIC